MASRQRLFVCRPADGAAEEACAREIISTLARRAYRRPVTAADVDHLYGFFETARPQGRTSTRASAPCSSGCSSTPSSCSASRARRPTLADAVYRIDDIELASRLSFFLWNSIPDDELLALAERGELARPAVLDEQVRRMLADPRSASLAGNFVDRWLELHKIRNVAPDPTIFPAFDQNLRDAMQQETALFMASQLREDRAVVDLLRADDTFLNERLARTTAFPASTGTTSGAWCCPTTGGRGCSARRASSP